MWSLLNCQEALLGFWVCLLLAVRLCHGYEIVELVGIVECADCAQSNIKSSHAFSGLRVKINCKFASGEIKARAVSNVNEEGKFSVNLSNEIVKDGELKEKCYAQLHSASGTPCTARNDKEASEIKFKSNKSINKKTFELDGKLEFSRITCTSAFLWPFFKYPPLPKLPHFPGTTIEFPPLPPKIKEVFHFPPPHENLIPPPVPIPENSIPPPVPVYKKPLPPPVPVYEKPLPPPVPIYKKPLPPPVPQNKKSFPPPTRIYKKPLPPPVPVYEKPLPPPYSPPVPTYKKSLPPPLPPPVPIYKKPLPPHVPQYKKPFPPPTPPIYKKPLPPPVPIFKEPLPPPIPIFKKPLPPFVPILEKPLPPPLPVFKKPPLLPFPPPVPITEKPPTTPSLPMPPPTSVLEGPLPQPAPTSKKPSPPTHTIEKSTPPTSKSLPPLNENPYPPFPKAPPIPELPHIPALPRKFFNKPNFGYKTPFPPHYSHA